MYEVLSERRQLMKWVGIFFWGGGFSRGSLMGGNFPSRNFPGEIFLEPYNITYWVFIKGVSGGGDGDFLKISFF